MTNPEQGKPEPQPWMAAASHEQLTTEEAWQHEFGIKAVQEVKRRSDILAKHYAASQPLVPQRNSPTYAERAAQMLDSLSAHGFLAIDDSEKLENAAAIIVAVLRAMQLEPLVTQQGFPTVCNTLTDAGNAVIRALPTPPSGEKT